MHAMAAIPRPFARSARAWSEIMVGVALCSRRGGKWSSAGGKSRGDGVWIGDDGKSKGGRCDGDG